MGEFNRGIGNTEALRTDLGAFTEAIAPLAREEGLNPHLEFWEVDHVDTLEGGVTSAISKTGFLHELRVSFQLGGNIGRVLYAFGEYREKGFDYLFVHKQNADARTTQSFKDLAQKIRNSLGIRVDVLAAE